jgi:hypothetical protein
MKPLMSFMVPAIMVLSFQGAARAQIRIQARQIPPPSGLGSTNLNLGSSNQLQGRLFEPLPPVPETPLPETPLPKTPLPEIPPAEMPEQNFFSGRLPPGVYEAKPYAGIVIVPAPEHDDESVLGAGKPNPFPNMPIIKPGLKMVPLPRPEP